MRLDLSLNLIGDKAFCIIMEQMTSNSCLQEANFGSNLLTDEVVSAQLQSCNSLTAFMSNNKALKVLGLSCNKFSAASHPPLKKALLLNKYLDAFDISNNEMSFELETELIEIATKKQLERLDITFMSSTALKKYIADQRKKDQPEEAPKEKTEEKLEDQPAHSSPAEQKIEGSHDEVHKEA